MKKLSEEVFAIYGYGIFEIFLAWKLAQDAKKVIFHRPWMGPFPRWEEQYVGKGIPWIEQAEYWEDVKKEGLEKGYIFCFFDVGDGPKQEELRAAGGRVFGVSGELEMDREKFKKTLISRGLPVPKYDTIIGVDDLYKLLHEQKDLWIKLDVENRGTMETCYHENWEKSANWFYKLAHELGCSRTETKFMWEKPIPGVEPGWDNFTSKGIPSEEGLMGMECKGDGYVCTHLKLAELPKPLFTVYNAMLPVEKKAGINASGATSSEVRIPENKQGVYIDACYSEDTEILTDTGWKFFPDLKLDDLVCTRSDKSDIIEYQSPTDYIAQIYKGKMILISNRDKDIECLVTPNHGVWRTDRHGRGLFKEQADSLTDKGYIPRTGTWKGESPEYFFLPEYRHEWFSGQWGKIYKEKNCPTLKIPIRPWLQFMALYLSDGSMGNKDYVVQISQWDKKSEYKKILSQLPFDITDFDGGLRINSIQLGTYMSQFGLYDKKFVPMWIKQLNPELLSLFLDTYIIADGNVHKGQRQYFTTSKQLADDLQEIAFKAGRLSNIRKGNLAGTLMTAKGKTYKRNFDGLIIAERPKQIRYWFETQSRKYLYITEQDYDGFVHDVTVPNGIIYVRRNGKPFWSSNCRRMGNPPAASISRIYKNFTAKVRAIADGMDIPPEWAAKYAAELTVEVPEADTESIPMELNDKDMESIKIRCACKVGNLYYNIPFKLLGNTVIKATGLGATREEAEFEALETAERFKKKCSGAFWNKSTFEELEEEIDKAKKYGIDKF
jgi:hypothetical protein